MPDISVIMPIYNTEKYIARCLDSIVMQTLSNIEIICVDDCSSDNSSNVVKAYARNDTRVRLIRHSANLGPGGARNSGLEVAQGDYVAFIDSDDYVDPNFLEYLSRGTDGGRVDIATCGYRLLDEYGQTEWEHSPDDKLVDNTTRKSMLWDVTHPHFCDKLWRRSLFLDNAISMPTNCYFEDVFTIPTLLYHAQNVQCGGKVLYHYFNRSGSITNSGGKKHLIDLLLAIDNIKDFMISRGLYQTEHQAFRNFYEGLFEFHVRKLKKNGMTNAHETDKFLRLSSLLRQGYSTIDDQLRGVRTSYSRAGLRALLDS